MEELAEKEKLKHYENRFADWIGRQGILFQLRYASTIGATSLIGHLGSVFAKSVIALALFAGLGYFVLGSHFKSDSYEEKMSAQLQSALGLEEIEAKGFVRSRGTGGYRGLVLTGGEKSFFYEAKITGYTAPLSYFTGLTQKWSPESVDIAEVALSVKSGGFKEEVEEAYAGFLTSLEGGGVTAVVIDDFSCEWGYSKLTYGRIQNAKLRADLKGGQWIVSLTGGKFQQNWLRDCEVVKGSLLIDASGIEIVSLDLKHGSGSVSLSGTIGAPLEKPTFALEGEFTQLALHKLLQLPDVTARDFMEGYISGDLKISGSTNSFIKMAGSAKVSPGTSLTIREKWPVLKAISIIDNQRSFRRVNFSEGSFDFSTEEGGMVIQNLDLRAGETAKLVGEFKTQLPTQAEAASYLGITLTDNFTNDLTDTSAAQKLEDDRMSLDFFKNEAAGPDDLDLRILSEEEQRFSRPARGEQTSETDLEEVRLREEMEIHRISGRLSLAVPASSFDENENLAKLYPADEEGWRWIQIPLRNHQFSKISIESHQRLLDQAMAKSATGG